MTEANQQKRGEKESGKKEEQAGNRGHSLLQPQNPLPLTTSAASATDTANQGLAYTAEAPVRYFKRGGKRKKICKIGGISKFSH